MTDEQKTKKAENNSFKQKRADISKNSEDIKQIEGKIEILSEKTKLTNNEQKNLEELKTKKQNLEYDLHQKKTEIGKNLTPDQIRKLTANNAKRNKRNTKSNSL